mgnify:CR=1 FL=1
MTDVKKLYDSTAKRYDLRQNNPFTKILREREISLIKKHVKGRILDIGCGTGYHLKFLKKLGNKSSFGIDISSNMLMEAKTQNLIHASAEELPFYYNTFNSILCMFTTLNLFDYDKSIKEMRRILSDDGTVILSVASIWDKKFLPLKERLTSNIKSHRKRLRIDKYFINLKLFSKDELVDLFKKHGFELTDFSGLFILQRPLWGNFNITRDQGIKLKEEKTLSRRFAHAACMYLAVFKKV